MSCRLIFVRHGQSMGNLSNTYLGHTDLALSELGTQQAKMVGEFLKNREIDNIYSSDLLRAYQTSLPLATLKNIKPIKSAALREIFAGKWENCQFSTLKDEFKQSYAIWLDNIGLACPDGGESVLSLQNRIVKEIIKIAKENAGKTVAVFTHATPIRTFFAYIRGYLPQEIKNIPWATNASVSEAVFENGEFTEIYYSRDDFLDSLASGFPQGV